MKMGETSPKLLDLMIGKERECLVTTINGSQSSSTTRRTNSNSNCDEKKLQLKLGLPCEEDWQNKQGVNNIQLSHQLCYPRIPELQNTAVNNVSQKRAAPAPVVGWPPIRSFRKNLASPSSSSAKAGAEPQRAVPSKPVNEKQTATENTNKGLFVKINMDGVPIGRKVDLNACNCYENLSASVDTLFRGLLTALKASSAGGTENKQDEQKPITGLLDGTGEYTLVYEDNEGDRMLVGDVPWHMFVSTVKRLRVLKTSDLPTLCRGNKQGKMMIEGAPK